MTTFTRYPYAGPSDQLVVSTVESPWSSVRTVRTIEHQLLESSMTLYTLRPPRPSAGTMKLRLPSITAAHAARDFFSTPSEFGMSPVNPPELAGRFVVTGGDITVAQDVGSWVVSLPWREVLG
ncbi:hypothetical protein [Microbacterium lacticum]|uniref:Uncharacterized protein n=1 Tax=Microbacterium lacticum TaxID=33885 RepID=A0A4Y3UN92_9MICO|nr:hypothetical protein [Microbacterium lacticum]TQN00435.1 hypothetical protein FHX68_0529 [Microbacterium lacticum]GEB94385.1 hypothetical protein MLA01_06040 [Microbacterium lacticum]GGN17946.1 hypothetical protein GCM10009724_09660 [Microbacterium lacticum]